LYKILISQFAMPPNTLPEGPELDSKVKFHMPSTLRNLVEHAKERTPWHFSNEVLYDLCRKHPLHTEIGVVAAKILLIGRVYAAAIERRKSKVSENDDFYLSDVAPQIIKSPIDRWIENAKDEDRSVAESLETMVNIHAKTTQLFSKISGLEKRSLASKYLHFHVPGLFFIYDSRAVKGMRAVSHIVGRGTPYIGAGDKEYRKFAGKCARLHRYCVSEFGINLKPRQVDNLLLALSTKGT